MSVYVITGSDESLNYLQRLGYEVDSYRSIIDYLFTNHKDDPTFINSEIFCAYQKKYEKVEAEYVLAKKEYGEKELRPIVEERCGIKGVLFTWNIPDFTDKKVEIYIAD